MDELNEKQKQLAETITYHKHNATEALKDGQTQREVLEHLKTDADAAKTIATAAIAKADSILNQTQLDLKILSGNTTELISGFFHCTFYYSNLFLLLFVVPPKHC